ncbi:hypothetical protein GDO78_014242 [Eleutherodactylus coqui]|uniref:Uncharacterized protein n=1 Tax=Eleutherodactylus coqui TaxID=57060 RepID=A0A8J6BFP3_ELECQ|nr:hypothetical protein GDO78_014242 [Eleutherodactylus coqui]
MIYRSSCVPSLCVSTDGPDERNPPAGRPCLYPQDCPEEDPDVPENQQGENLIKIKVEVKDEVEETDIRTSHLYALIGRNPPEGRPNLYPQDCPAEDPSILEGHQGEDQTETKVKVEERMMGDHLCKKEVEEEIPVNVITENRTVF